MRVLVTGGTGYIGAHTAHLLAERGDHVVIVDDLVTGSVERVAGFPLARLDLAEAASRSELVDVLRAHRIDAVIHFAARKQVAESVERPAWYYEQNVGGTAGLLLAMEQAGIARLIFSSSAAVYGSVDGTVSEVEPTRPTNPYGATKRAGEQMIEDCASAWGLSAASLRYFNVAGAARPALADHHGTNLLPLVFARVAAGERPVIFGDDYPTADGTCVRDYVHVVDVAEAHLAVLDTLPDRAGNTLLNVGTGVGTTVRQMVEEVGRVIGRPLDAEVVARRPGDSASVVADVTHIGEAVGWRSRFSLTDIVESEWAARRDTTSFR